MADESKEQNAPVHGSSIWRNRELAYAVEETQNIDTADDFDPFSGVVECIDEHIDIQLSAPPENQWYHGRLDRTSAEERLVQTGQTQSYLIRESERKPGSYVLSFSGRTGISHFRITAMCGDYYIGGREFDTLSELIGYYTSWSDLLKAERLVNPVAPPEPVYDKRKVIAILPYTQMPETDELSFEKGEVFILHNDMGDGWLWAQSLSTELSGIINQDFVQELNGNVDPVITNDWFWSDITKEEATAKLAKAGSGSWLVRPSDSTQGDYSLFFCCNKQIQRFKIQKKGNKYYMGGRYFEGINEITQRYKKEQIVEGYTLQNAVSRPRSTACRDDSSVNNKDIYASMRQSSGSNFFLNRKDNIIIKGYLNKKSQRTKKWKNMYFVLNETELQLYYFENHKRTKPKGLIDLNYSSLYPVHDGFFGRPNCFQIVLRALNHVQVYYMCADNSDQAQDWIQALKPYCLNTQRKKTTKQPPYPTATELHSLHIKICDARKLPTKAMMHPYCIVLLNDTKVCRTPAKEGPDPCWDEDFLLDDIPPDIESFTISLYNKGKRSKDTEVVSARYLLSDLSPGVMADQWLNLVPVNPTTKAEGGTIRINAKYLHEVIMPIQEYKSLKELICDKDLQIVFALKESCCSDRKMLASCLLQIFRHECTEAHLLQVLGEKEIEEEESSAQLFRGTSFFTTLMDQYMQMTCTHFVHTAVQSYIDKVMESKQVNPSHDNSSDAEANAKYLISTLNDVVNQIFMSAEHCPQVLRYLFGCLQRKAQKHWPSDSQVRTRVVSGFVFLRLLCLAIRFPKHFNLITEPPSQSAMNTLKMVANALIKLANLTEVKEQYTEVVNPFLRDNQHRMVSFLDNLSNVPESPQITEGHRVDLARPLATIHQICSDHLAQLDQIGKERPYVKKLVTVVEMLTNHRRHYISQ